MKNLTKTIIVMILLIPVLLLGESGLTVSFQSGYPMNQTGIGLKLGPLAPYGGVGLVRVSGSFEDSYTSWERDWDSGEMYKDYERSSKSEGTATLLFPFAGLRFYLKQSNLMMYVKGEVMLAIPSLSATDEGERIYYNPDGSISDIETWDDELTDEDKEDIKDALDFVVLSPGFGIEYPVSDHFSIGGEFGIRVLLYGYEMSGSDSDEDYYREEWEDKIGAMLAVTYTSFTLNYRF